MMSGMFWHNNHAPSVQIDSLLSEEDITLCKLMDAEDILQECKSQNKKLLEYLTRSDILEELVNLITEEPSQDLEERWRYKYSNVACELLTCEVPILTQKLAGNEMLLSKLYSFIDKDQPLNPLLASFFSKTLHALLRRASDQNWFSHQFVCLQVLDSLKNRKNCVDLLLQHIETSAIMDLILILLTKIDGDEIRQNILKWLDDQRLVQRLVYLLSPSSDPEKHTNASQLLCDIVKSPCMEPEKRPDPILKSLQSEETIKLILDTILTEEKLESSIVGGVRILINLLGQKENKITESSETYGVPFNNIVEDTQRDKFALVIIPYLDKFNQLLLDPPEKPSVKTTAGFLEKPFGRTRLYILILYASLLSTENSEVLKKFAELNTFNILLDLFFQFAWNNFLHTQVQQCLSLVMNCDCLETNEIIYSHMFVQSKLINRILEAWENNDNNKLNQGYMGHLIMIANEIVKIYEENNVFSNYLKTNLSEETIQKWEHFVATQLDEINKTQQLTLGEPPEAYMMSSSGNSDDYASFPQDSYGSELYTNFQKQSNVPVYVNTVYDFQMENEGDEEYDTSQQTMDQFKLPDDDFEKTQELFNKICEEKKFEDINTDEEWGKRDEFSMDKSDWMSKKIRNSSSSDEDEDEDLRESCQESNPIELWNPWSSETSEPTEQTGWANFDNFNSAFNTEISFQSKPCNEVRDELPEVPIVNENISKSENETGNNLNNSENKGNINEVDDAEVKTEETNVSSVASSVNIPDSNANLTVLENRTSESKDVSKNVDGSSSNISEASSKNLDLANIETVTSTADNVSSIAAVPEPSK